MAPSPELNDSGLYTHVSTAESCTFGTEEADGDYVQLPTDYNHEDGRIINYDAPKSSARLSSSMASLSTAPSQMLSQALGSSCSLKTLKDWIKQRWGWLVTLCNFLLYHLCSGFLCCYTLLFVYLQQEFRSSATETGWVGSIAMGVSYFITPVTNYLIFRLRSTRLVVFLGVICCSVSLISSSFVTDVYYLYGTIGVLYGCGVNFIWHSSVVLLVQYFPGRNCTRCVSFTYLGSPSGLLVISLVMSAAMNTIGWRATLRFFGAGIFVICSLCCLPLIPPPNPNQIPIEEKAEEKEEKERLQSVSSVDESMKVVSDQGDEISRKESEMSSSSPLNSLKSFMTLTPAWISSIAFFLSALAQTFHNVNFVGHLHVIGLEDHGAIMMTSLAAGEICGKLFLAAFGGKFPYSKGYFLAVSNLASALATIPIAVVTSVPALIILSAGLGVLRSGYLVAGHPFLVDFFGISRIYEATCSMMLSAGLGYLLGSLVMGMSYDYTGSYVISIIVATGLFAASGVLFLVVQFQRKWIRTRRKKKLQKQFVTYAKPLPQQTVPMLHPDGSNLMPKSTFIIEDIV